MRGEAQRVLAAVDHVDAMHAQPLFSGVGAVALELRCQFAGEQQAGALHLGDQAAELGLQCFQFLHGLFAAQADVLAHVRRQAGEGGAGHVQRTRVGGHGVAVYALAIQAGGVCGDGQHRQRELRTVQCLGIGFHVRRVQRLVTGVIDEGQCAVRAQRGLDGVDQQQAAVFAGQFACQLVEACRHGAARVAFAHHRLQEHRFDEPVVGFRVGKHLAQRGLVIRGDGDDAALAAIAGQMLVIGLAAGIGIQRRAIGTAVEAALDHHALDGGAGMACARIGLQLGIDIGDARGQADGFGAGVQAHEMRKRTAATAVADLLAHCLGEAALGQAWGHDVGHHLRLCRGGHHVGRGVAETEHAVAAGVIQHRALERDHPRAVGGQCDVRHHRVIGVEIDEAGLHRRDLVFLVQIQQIGDFGFDAAVFIACRLDGAGQVGMGDGQTLDAGIVQTLGKAGAGVRAKRGEGAEYGHAHLQNFLV
ncbi:hypothetical protein D3C81_1030270 [compost metagenome]